MQIDTEQSEIEVARERLARAQDEFKQADDEANGPQRRLAKARKELFDAQAEVNRFTHTRMMGGRKI